MTKGIASEDNLRWTLYAIWVINDITSSRRGIFPDQDKMQQEIASLQRIGDNFKKIVIVGGYTPTHRNEDGILILNIMDFLKGDKGILDE